MATRRLGRGLVGEFAVHDTISKNPSCHTDVVLEHYRRVAESLTFGKTANLQRQQCTSALVVRTVMVRARIMNPEQGTRPGFTMRAASYPPTPRRRPVV